MAMRLALLGVALVVVGLFNITGYGRITIAAGALALLAAAVAWAVSRGRTSSNSRR